MAFNVPVCADPPTAWSPIGLSDLDDDEVFIVSLYRNWQRSLAGSASGSVSEVVPEATAMPAVIPASASAAPARASVIATPGNARSEFFHEIGATAALKTVFSLLRHRDSGAPEPESDLVADHSGAGGGSQAGLSWAETGLLALLSPGAEAARDGLDLDLAEALRRCRQQLAGLGIDLRAKDLRAKDLRTKDLRAKAVCTQTDPTLSPADRIRGSAQNNGAGYVTAYVTALSIA